MVELREIAEVEVAYVRHIGSYLDTHHAWNKLTGWAAEQGLYAANQQFIGISLDDGSIRRSQSAGMMLALHFRRDSNGRPIGRR